MEENKDVLNQLAEMTGGKVDWAMRLPDGSGAATMSFPLPKDNWLYTPAPTGFNVPPMPMRMGKATPMREFMEKALREAGRYAVRCATMNGIEQDFDPDALVQNLVVGMLGYHTADGLSTDEWANPNGEVSEERLSTARRCAEIAREKSDEIGDEIAAAIRAEFGLEAE